METNLKNRYFLVRHGQNIHQAQHPGIIYHWPDGNPPYSLTEQGKEEARKAGKLLKDKKIDVIFSSDILRCTETAKIIAKEIEYDIDKIIYDTRLRDLNWGDFGGKTKEEYWTFYGNDRMNAFEKPVPGGESWNECRERVIKFFNETEGSFQNNNILLVSHGDPLWLLEGYIRNMDNQALLGKRSEIILKTGEVKEIYE
jgi:broad specificity phosphatase PhoE